MIRKRFPMSPTPSFFDPTKYFPEGFFFKEGSFSELKELSHSVNERSANFYTN